MFISIIVVGVAVLSLV